jgi:hypothetical protein
MTMIMHDEAAHNVNDKAEQALIDSSSSWNGFRFYFHLPCSTMFLNYYSFIYYMLQYYILLPFAVCYTYDQLYCLRMIGFWTSHSRFDIQDFRLHNFPVFIFERNQSGNHNLLYTSIHHILDFGIPSRKFLSLLKAWNQLHKQQMLCTIIFVRMQ